MLWKALSWSWCYLYWFWSWDVFCFFTTRIDILTLFFCLMIVREFSRTLMDILWSCVWCTKIEGSVLFICFVWVILYVDARIDVRVSFFTVCLVTWRWSGELFSNFFIFRLLRFSDDLLVILALLIFFSAWSLRNYLRVCISVTLIMDRLWPIP